MRELEREKCVRENVVGAQCEGILKLERERERERGRGRRQLPCGTVDSSLETKIFVCPFSLSL